MNSHCLPGLAGELWVFLDYGSGVRGTLTGALVDLRKNTPGMPWLTRSQVLQCARSKSARTAFSKNLTRRGPENLAWFSSRQGQCEGIVTGESRPGTSRSKVRAGAPKSRISALPHPLTPNIPRPRTAFSRSVISSTTRLRACNCCISWRKSHDRAQRLDKAWRGSGCPTVSSQSCTLDMKPPSGCSRRRGPSDCPALACGWSVKAAGSTR